MVVESNQSVFLIQIDASSFAEFEISEFEISIIDCIVQSYRFSAVILGYQSIGNQLLRDKVDLILNQVISSANRLVETRVSLCFKTGFRLWCLQ